MKTQAKDAPSLPFAIVISIEYIYAPVFINLTEDNVMEYAPNTWIAFSLLFIILSQVFT
jgi:hypothetical protein